MYCACLDAHNNYPVSLEEILQDIQEMKMKLDKGEY